MLYIHHYHTPEGFDDLVMCSNGKVLTGLWFEGSHDDDKHVSDLVETQNFASLPSVFNDTIRWLDTYFSGCQPDFTPAYHVDNITPFRKLVSKIMCEIPFGQIMTYGEIAKRIVETFQDASLPPRKMSAQAVGGAVGWNPICLIVPCHRVVGADGNLTGYGGGMNNKIALLEFEGHDMSKFRVPNKARPM